MLALISTKIWNGLLGKFARQLTPIKERDIALGFNVFKQRKVMQFKLIIILKFNDNLC